MTDDHGSGSPSEHFEDLYDVLGRGAGRTEVTQDYREAARWAVEAWDEQDGVDVVVLTVTGHGARIVWSEMTRVIQQKGIPARPQHGLLKMLGVHDANRGGSSIRLLPATTSVVDGHLRPSLLIAFVGGTA